MTLPALLCLARIFRRSLLCVFSNWSLSFRRSIITVNPWQSHPTSSRVRHEPFVSIRQTFFHAIWQLLFNPHTLHVPLDSARLRNRIKTWAIGNLMEPVAPRLSSDHTTSSIPREKVIILTVVRSPTCRAVSGLPRSAYAYTLVLKIDSRTKH